MRPSSETMSREAKRMSKKLTLGSWLAAWVVTASSALAVTAGSPDLLRPERFGAKANGIHDDTWAIQKCIDRIGARPANATGYKGTVWLEGTYYVTRQIQVVDETTAPHELTIGPHWRVFHVTSGITIAGGGTVTLLENGASSRKNPASHTYVFWVTSDPRHVAPVSAPPVRNVAIQNIQIINDPASLHPTSSENAAILVAGGADITIDHVRMDYWHRAIKLMGCIRSRITRCRVEDARYIGIGVYGSGEPVADSDRNEISANELVGNTQLSGGIYVSGDGTLIRDNTLEFTHGICTEAYSGGRIENNRIARSPYGIRVGYVTGSGARSVVVRNNSLLRCAGGIMVGHGFDVSVSDNRIAELVKWGGDFMIETPNGYWGFGRTRAGINVEDSQNVRVTGNHISGLNSGAPVGIRVSSLQGAADTSAPQDPDWNTGNVITDNRVEATSGWRIGYYLENQRAYTFENNMATGDESNRIIACRGQPGMNQLEGQVRVVDRPTAQCQSLNLYWHPMSRTGMPQGGFKLTLDRAQEQQYFPPLSRE